MRLDEARTRQVSFESAKNRIETLHVTDLEHESAFGGERSQLTRVGRAFGDRLFDEEMFAAREKIVSDFEMCVRGCCDRSGIHLFRKLCERRRRRNSKFI